MNAELRPLLNFILNHTQFSFKSLIHSPIDNLTIWANFHYEGITATIEGFPVKKTDVIGNYIDGVCLMLIDENTQTAFKIYQRNQKLQTILN